MRSTTNILVCVLLLFGAFTMAGCSPGQKVDETPTDESTADVEQLDEVTTAMQDVIADAGGMSRSDALIAALTIFVVAIFLGFELITKVPPTLHTPLMSGSNAISGITVVGAVLMAGCNEGGMAAFLGMIAVAMAMVNVVGGFMVTDRMLSMFKKK